MCRADEPEKKAVARLFRSHSSSSTPNRCCVPPCRVTPSPRALRHIAYKAVDCKILCATRQRTRASSRSRYRAERRGVKKKKPLCVQVWDGEAKKKKIIIIREERKEMRTVQHYSGQLSSRHRGDETDPYARHDYDATHCPAIFTGLPPFQIRYHLIDKGPADSRYLPHHLNRFASTLSVCWRGARGEWRSNNLRK